MKKTLSFLVLAAFVLSLSEMGIADTYAYPPQRSDVSRHDSNWQDNHDRQWRTHEQAWREQDRQWNEHAGDRRWQEEHAHQWRDWYQWHHDNGDSGFDDFLVGVVVGAVLGTIH